MWRSPSIDECGRINISSAQLLTAQRCWQLATTLTTATALPRHILRSPPPELGDLLVHYHLFETNRCFLRYSRDFCILQYACVIDGDGERGEGSGSSSASTPTEVTKCASGSVASAAAQQQQRAVETESGASNGGSAESAGLSDRGGHLAKRRKYLIAS